MDKTRHSDDRDIVNTAKSSGVIASPRANDKDKRAMASLAEHLSQKRGKEETTHRFLVLVRHQGGRYTSSLQKGGRRFQLCCKSFSQFCFIRVFKDL